MTDATRAPITRRATLATVGGIAFTTIAPPANAGECFNPEPTWHGRRFLRYCAMMKYLLRAPLCEAREDAICERIQRYHAELFRLQGEILAKPVTSVPDMVDRLILLAHECDPSWDVERGNVMPILGSALAAAGILPGDAMVGEADEANRLAAAGAV